MVFGLWTKNKIRKSMKGTTLWIKNLDMVSIFGKINGYIKEIFRMIIDKDMDSYIIITN
jgi:hypothetical protein